MKNLLPAILLLLGRLISSSQSYVITGVHAGINNETGARPFRQEINKFKSSGPAWDLYVLSLQHLMAVDQDDQYSYYRISGMYHLPSTSVHSLVAHIQQVFTDILLILLGMVSLVLLEA